MGATVVGECRRCNQPCTLMGEGVLCDCCVQDLRINAALDGQAIAAVFDPDDDHRSPGERLRED